MVTILLEKRTRKGRRTQMHLELVSQFGQAWDAVVVTDRSSRSFPDVLLRIEIGRRGREAHDLQARVVGQHLPHCCSLVPGCAIPQQQDGLIGIGVQNGLEMHRRRIAVHHRAPADDLRTRLEVQGAVEVGFTPSRIDPHRGCCTARCPDRRRGRLQVQCRFVFGQDDRLGCILYRINQFFSIWSSKSSTAWGRRERKTRAGRWELKPQRRKSER